MCYLCDYFSNQLAQVEPVNLQIQNRQSVPIPGFVKNHIFVLLESMLGHDQIGFIPLVEVGQSLGIQFFSRQSSVPVVLYGLYLVECLLDFRHGCVGCRYESGEHVLYRGYYLAEAFTQVLLEVSPCVLQLLGGAGRLRDLLGHPCVCIGGLPYRVSVLELFGRKGLDRRNHLSESAGLAVKGFGKPVGSGFQAYHPSGGHVERGAHYVLDFRLRPSGCGKLRHYRHEVFVPYGSDGLEVGRVVLEPVH